MRGEHGPTMETILDVIDARVSTRRFRPDAVPAAELAAIVAAGEAAAALTPGGMRLHLVADGRAIDGEIQGIVGDYGKVLKAPHYLVLAAEETTHYLLDSGYRFEQAILEATRRGIGTCWVGGWFHEEQLRAVLGFERSLRVVALTPLGHSAAKPEGGILNRVVRLALKAGQRAPVDELFFWRRAGAPLPESVRADERFARVFEAVRWAPSWANRQPWRFVLTPEEVLLYKEARQIKEGKDYHLVDCGIAMCHVHLAAQALGLSGRWSVEPFHVPNADARAEPIARYVFDVAPGLPSD